MTLALKLGALNTKFDTLSTVGTVLPGGVQAQVATAKSQFTGMATAVPNQLSSFYGNFSQNLQTVGAMTKAIGTLQDNPSSSICGVISFIASGDFLNGLGDKIDALLSAIANGASDILAKVTEFLAELDKALGLTEALQEIEDFIAAAGDALADFAQSVGAAGLKDLLNLVSCLTHAAEFTTNRATLVARQAAMLNLNVRQAGNLSLQHTGITNVAQTFTQGMTARLNNFI